ncbi:RHS repeat domain-containing protein [Flavobacterium rhizosphaerae]|uniref:RHS repeat-associated core domain-containing protein n=1 Tax=Flavobacterium rhizosphaerae TaxID=3163298 RepID=A0ABW8YTC1_9FLAO
MKTTNQLKRIIKQLLLATLLLTGSICFAQQIDDSNIYNYTAIQNNNGGNGLTFEDPDYNSTQTYVTLNPKIYIRLYDDAYTPHPAEFKTIISVKVTAMKQDGNWDSPYDTELLVEYNPNGNSYNFTDLSSHEIPNRYGVKVEVINIATYYGSITTPANTLYPTTKMEIGFAAERYYQLDADQGNTVSGNVVNESNEQGQQVPVSLPLKWNEIEGAIEYELEWTWVDDYNTSFTSFLSASQIKFSERDFELNHTKIRTKNTSYSIPLIYSSGYIIYRVRGVGRFMEDSSKEQFGRWSSGTNQKTVVSNWSNSYKKINSHDNKKNWQFQASYAEEGKKKDVVSYFDGTLRNRQTVTVNNSDNTAIVGETFYDNQGRAAVEVLPVPLFKKNYLRYFHNLNRNLVDKKYSHYDFDWDIEGLQCAALLSGMIEKSGSSQYYSPNNNFTGSPFRDFIPQAFTYPFSQVEYTPDNTGRITRKGGVGPNYQLGSGHEMKYFYSSPFQEELNRLFGYEVGWNSHYKKNITVDPNGQVSVAYLDPQGRTIATALAGESPESLIPLPDTKNNALHQSLTIDLLNNAPNYINTDTDNNILSSSNDFGNHQDILTLSKQLGVAGNNIGYNFEYGIFQQSSFNSCPGYYPFVYDLQLSLKDDCAQDVMESVNLTLGTENPGGGVIPIDFGVAPQAVLNTGNYTLFKELRVNKEALNNYADFYESQLRDPNSECYVDPGIFAPVLEIDCETTCADCRESIGTQADYILTELKGYYNIADNDNTSLTINTTNLQVTIGASAVDVLGNAIEQQKVNGLVYRFSAEWDALNEACEQLCRPTFASSCNFMEKMLLKDVSPMGQYGAIDSQAVTANPDEQPYLLSIFNEQNQLIHHGEIIDNDWRHPTLIYRDEEGQVSMVEVVLNADNTTYSPPVVPGASIITGDDGLLYTNPHQLLNVEDFLANWKDTWAESLVVYHPEYCYLEYTRALCNVTKNFTVTSYDNTSQNVPLNSDEYDDYLNYIDTYQEAVQEGLFSLSNPGYILSNDPYFTYLSGYENSTVFNLRKGIMLQAINTQYENYTISQQNTTAITMLQAAYKLINCNALQACNITSFNYSSLSTEDKDRLWNTYKNLYKSLKDRIRHVFINVYAKANGCYNGCIGDSGSTNITSVIENYPQRSSIDTYINSNNPTATTPVTPVFCDNYYAINYQFSKKRFVPIDFALDYKDDAQGTMDQLTAMASYEYYMQTGSCPRIQDMDLFLNNFFEAYNTNVNVSSLNNTSHAVGQYFTFSLFQDFTGLTAPIPDTPQPLINTSVSGNALTFSFTPTALSATPYALRLNLPSTPFTSGLSWNNYGLTGSWHIIGFAQLYYNASTSNFTDVNNPVFGFSVIARVSKGSEIQDVLITGTTRAKIGECSVSGNSGVGESLNPSAASGCSQKDYFAAALKGLVWNLQVANSVNSTVNLMNNSYFNPQPYVNDVNESFLRYYFGVQPTDQVTWSVSNQVYTITINGTPRFVFHPNGNLLYANDITLGDYTPGSINWPVSITYNAATSVESSYGYASAGNNPLYLVCCSPCGQWDFNGNGIGDDCDEGTDPYVLDCEDIAYAENEARYIFVVDVEVGYVVGSAGINYDAQSLPDNFILYYLNTGTPIGAETPVDQVASTGFVGSYLSYSTSSPQYQIAYEGIIHPYSPSNTTTTSYPYPVKVYNGLTGQWDVTGLTETHTYTASDITSPSTGTGTLTFNANGSKNMMRIKIIGGSSVTVWDIVGFICPPETGGRPAKSTASLQKRIKKQEDLETAFAMYGFEFPEEEKKKLVSTDATASKIPGNPAGLAVFTDPSLTYVAPSCNCVPQPVAPVPCEQKYAEFISFLNFNSQNASTVIQNLDLDEIPSLQEFYNGSLQYLVDSYIYYITSLGVTSTYHPEYLSLTQFGNTQLNYGYLQINDAINSYDTYASQNSNNQDRLFWNDYINTVYILTAQCPPAPMPVYSPPFELGNPCEDMFESIIATYTDNSYESYIAYLRDEFIRKYIETAMGSVKERFNVKYADKEYQYTLYYYDQAGNLLQTVAPEGVHRFEANQLGSINAAINSHRENAQPILNVPENPSLVPQHNFKTEYKYNSLNQLIWQKTPDGGVTRFAYDRLGRIIASQNARQATSVAPTYYTYMSYTEYDELGRIIEAGEVRISPTVINFGTYKIDDNGRLININQTGQYVASGFNPQSIKREVTKTFYDNSITIPGGVQSSSLFESSYKPFDAKNRVTAIAYYEAYDPQDLTDFDNAIFYNYDVHGNVKEVVNYYAYLREGSCNFTYITDPDTGRLNDCEAYLKRVIYEYDLISGNVTTVTFQPNREDQFIHKYEYDADNRLVSAKTSQNGSLWERDAAYQYYPHGPLARTETGAKRVQGTDYTYTLQGWIKSVNGDNNKDGNFDPGLDGTEGSLVNLDAFGYALTYNSSDYFAISDDDDGSYNYLPLYNSRKYNGGANLYNGNIKQVTNHMLDFDEKELPVQVNTYSYDQLNRINDMRSIAVIGGKVKDSYQSGYAYDRNGNLQKLVRNVFDANGVNGGSPLPMDSFEYKYTPGTNRLNIVRDGVDGPSQIVDFADDIEDQVTQLYQEFGINYNPNNPATHNYVYDAIGQLIEDKTEHLRIEWYVTGKVKKISKTDTGEEIYFDYNGLGQRIGKRIVKGTKETASHYALDAQGNTMAVYRANVTVKSGKRYIKMYLNEHDIYGSSRLGIEKSTKLLYVNNTSGTLVPGIKKEKFKKFANLVGDKRYELSNHLGNVLVVINDKKLPSSMQSPYRFRPDVMSYQDYYPFGMLQPERHGSIDKDGYRYGFQGQEQDDEVKGEGNSYDFGERLFDSRIGRWWSTDNYLKPWLTSYQFASNNPINNIDPDGNDEIHFYYRTQQMLNSEGKALTILILESEIIKNDQEHTFFMHSPTGATTQFHPFQNNHLPNQGSTAASDAQLPMSQGISWFFGLFEKKLDDYAYLGRLLQASPEIMDHYSNIREDGMRFKGAVNMAGSVEFTEKLITAEETVYAIVDGYYLVKGLSKFIVREYAKSALKITTSNLEFSAKMSKIGASGEIGESYLKSLGGASQVHFVTEVGKGGRFVDQLVNGIAYESKTGYTTLTESVKMQIAKDAELLANSKTTGVKKVIWTFFESPVTGKAGASKPLLKALEEAGIETQIIRNP